MIEVVQAFDRAPIVKLESYDAAKLWRGTLDRARDRAQLRLDVAWLQRTLQRESRRFDTDVELAAEGQLSVSWHVQDASRSDPSGSRRDAAARAEGSDVR